MTDHVFFGIITFRLERKTGRRSPHSQLCDNKSCEHCPPHPSGTLPFYTLEASRGDVRDHAAGDFKYKPMAYISTTGV
jgi:hypothetical protein